MAANTTTDPIFSLGEDFESIGFCNLWQYYPTGEDFAVVLPYNSICSHTSSNAAGEATYFLEATMYFGLIFLLIVMIQSMQFHKLDWYRLIAFYLVGTLGVPLSNEFGADAPGFNRFIGFGVLVHNMAEAAILAIVWRGSTINSNSSFGVRGMIVYFWIMLLLITFLPLNMLLWFASFQGATLDFFLVTTFATVAVKFGKNGKYFWISFAASLMHIITIQPLFLGMALGWTAMSAPTVIFLVPTFMIYIWFASSDPNAQLSLAQSTGQNVNKQHVINNVATKVIEHMRTQSLQSDGAGIRSGSMSGSIHQRLNMSNPNTYNDDHSRTHSHSHSNKGGGGRGSGINTNTTYFKKNINGEIGNYQSSVVKNVNHSDIAIEIVNKPKSNDLHLMPTNKNKNDIKGRNIKKTGVEGIERVASEIPTNNTNTNNSNGIRNIQMKKPELNNVTTKSIDRTSENGSTHGSDHDSNHGSDHEDHVPNEIDLDQHIDVGYNNHEAEPNGTTLFGKFSLSDDEANKGHNLNIDIEEPTGHTLRHKSETVDYIIKFGVLNSKHVENPKRLFLRAFGFALLGSLTDVIFLVTAPCWIDTSFLCEE